MSKRECIKTRGGQILGWIVTDSSGNKTVWNRESNKIMGYYRANTGVTTTATGRIFVYGDAAAALLPGLPKP